MKVNRRHSIAALIGLAVAALLIWGIKDEEQQPKQEHFHNQGKVFGTYYNIRYLASQDLEPEIQKAFTDFDNSLSLFNPHSILSAVNDNRNPVTDSAFEAMWSEAEEVYTLSGGAFDITVAPLVNYWGFGRTQSTDRSADRIQTDIDSLRKFVGFDKVELIDHHVYKAHPNVQIDAGAVAKGQACDMIASVLRAHGVEHFLIDIGGEIVTQGEREPGEPWRVGITKPNLNNEGAQQELQQVLALRNSCMATSGNYRNYYYADGERRSHTIDPRTGYPVQHSVLSATVVSSTCMRADALATACMVLGAEQALHMIDCAKDAACYLIVAQNDSLTVVQSPNWEETITK